MFRCSYDELIEQIWPANQRVGITKANLDELLSSLRKKIMRSSGGFTFLQTIRGYGIRLVA
jgi:DNA-binding response OmpR family regulator